MLTDALIETFDRIYATDLLFVRDCWQLCGDAHCCSFARYKAKFKLSARTPFQELPLLPGEYAYLEHRGLLAQFGDHTHKVIEYDLGGKVLRAEAVVSRRPHCACDHETRTTVCRLYPLLPVFDVAGKLTGTDTFGIYEDLEQLGELAPACQLTALPFPEIQKFLTIANAISGHPQLLFYAEAYRTAKAYVRARLQAAQANNPTDLFTLFERMVLRRQLINHDELRAQLLDVLVQFEAHYGMPMLAVR